MLDNHITVNYTIVVFVLYWTSVNYHVTETALHTLSTELLHIALDASLVAVYCVVLPQHVGHVHYLVTGNFTCLYNTNTHSL